MLFRDVVFALSAVLLWSANLIIIKSASPDIPLEFFNLMRFVCCIPLIFFIKKPPLALSKLFIVSLFWYVFNFFFMGLGLHYGMGAGVVSVVYQTCSFFGVFFCFLLLKETPRSYQIIGMLVAFVGIVLLSSDTFVNNLSSIGLIYILLAAFSWGIGVALIKKYQLAADISTNIWLSTFAVIPMTGMIFLRGGHDSFVTSFQSLSPLLIIEIVFAALGPTLMAGCLWFSLLRRYPSAVVTPFIFLLPPMSCFFSSLLLDERFSILQLTSFGVIMLGILLNQNLLKFGILKRYTQILWKKLTLTN